MRVVTSRLSRAVVLVATLAASACSLLTDAPLTTARVEVDPTTVRSIRYLTAEGSLSEPEMTTKRLDEIECLRAEPRCWVTDGITATIHNTGKHRLELHRYCYFPLEQFESGAWHRPPLACLAIGIPPLVIAPGQRYTFSIDKRGRQEGEYRVNIDLRDSEGTPLPARMRTSNTFVFQRLPDSPAYSRPGR